MVNAVCRWLVTVAVVFGEAIRDCIPAILSIIGDIGQLFRRCCRPKVRPNDSSHHEREPGRCHEVQLPPFVRPDPLIYSQRYLAQLGFAVTWDNPDIQLLDTAGTPVSSSSLAADTDYQIVARIWNNSTQAPVVGLPVRFSYLSFGIGTQSHPIGSTLLTLGVKGGSNHPAFATMLWHTPDVAGHYCIQAFLDWADDSNPLNNLGQENTDVSKLHSPGEATFALRNATPETLRYRFEVDAYAIPAREPCANRPARRPRRRDWSQPPVPPAHDRRNYPLPAGWHVTFDPAEPELAPGVEQLITATIIAPEGFTGSQIINVNAYSRRGFAGGVTITVQGA
jgi:hypothetical protein